MPHSQMRIRQIRAVHVDVRGVVRVAAARAYARYGARRVLADEVAEDRVEDEDDEGGHDVERERERRASTRGGGGGLRL